jgi:ribosomal protein S27E
MLAKRSGAAMYTACFRLEACLHRDAAVAVATGPRSLHYIRALTVGCVMTKSPFDDAEIKIRCPDCGKTNKQTVGWLRNHSQVACLGCGFLISPRTSKARRELLKIDEAWTKLRAALGKIRRK